MAEYPALGQIGHAQPIVGEGPADGVRKIAEAAIELKNFMEASAMAVIPALVLMVALSASPAFGQLARQPQDALQSQQAPVNPAIDMQGFLRVSQRAAMHRETRRVSEEEFARMSREPGTIVLDARSREKYDELHVKRAINLSFPDIAIESLKKTIPDKKARILIYCNNNFRNAEGPFPSKLPSASLNISTYIALYNYGYRNVYELSDTLELSASKLEFEPSPKTKSRL